MNFKREPALILAFFTALVGAAGLIFGWSGEQVGLASGLVSAVGAVVVAWKTQETWASAIINIVAALVALAVGFGLEISDDARNSIILIVTTGLAMFNRTQVSPVEPLPVPLKELDGTHYAQV